jgi:hypothetical protein
MRSVRYLKVVLTVIAACLALICLRDVSLVAAASARVDTIPGRYQIANSSNGFVVRVDSLTGQVCTYAASQDAKGNFTGCTPPGQ